MNKRKTCKRNSQEMKMSFQNGRILEEEGEAVVEKMNVRRRAEVYIHPKARRRAQARSLSRAAGKRFETLFTSVFSCWNIHFTCKGEPGGFSEMADGGSRVSVCHVTGCRSTI